jgi:DNA-binding CsgD family transcriptional regulator
MARLAHADLLGMLAFVREAESFPDLPAFRAGVLPGLRRLVPCDLVGYNEVDTATGQTLVVLDPEDAMFEGIEEVLGRLAHQHPLIARQAAGDMSTRAISDYLSVRRFHRLELYDELYQRIGAEDQIAFGLPGPVVIGIAMNRSRRSFTERDRSLLEMLRPHLAQAHRHALARERAGALLGAMKEGIDAAGAGVMLLDSNGQVHHESSAARELLRRYFHGASGMPVALAEWVADGPGSAPLEVEGERGRLTVRLLNGREPSVLLLEERRHGPHVEKLLALGLTNREAEVTRLVALGHTNHQIADELVVSRQTVRKHLERIYAKLGVHSRAEAACRALTI